MTDAIHIDFINEIEEKFPVSTWVIKGIHIWPVLRTILFLGSSQLEKNSVTAIETKSKHQNPQLKKIVEVALGSISYLSAYMKDSQNNASLVDPVDIIFLGHSTSRNLVNEKWMDVFFDPLTELLIEKNISSLVIESSSCRRYFIPRHRSSVFIQPLLDRRIIESKILSSLNLLTRRYSQDLDNCEKLTDCLEYISAQKGLTSQSTLKILLSHIYCINSCADLFEKIFLKNTPKMCFIVNYYGFEGMGMNLACKKLGIPSVDIQHGVQGSCHPAYGSWSSVPVDGYELLPNFFWCWSESEYRAIEKWSASVAPHHQPIIGGNNWLNMWQDEQSPIVKVYHQKVKEFILSKGAKTTILVSLQPLVAPMEIAPKWVMAAIKSSPSSWLWLIRLHPGMTGRKAEIEKLFQDSGCNNIEIDFATNIPLPALLTHTNCHVTQCSTVVIEAERFNVPSVITDSLGVEVFAEYIANGKAVGVSTTAELTMAIEKYLDTPLSSIEHQELDRLDFDSILAKLNYPR